MKAGSKTGAAVLDRIDDGPVADVCGRLVFAKKWDCDVIERCAERKDARPRSESRALTGPCSRGCSIAGFDIAFFSTSDPAPPRAQLEVPNCCPVCPCDAIVAVVQLQRWDVVGVFSPDILGADWKREKIRSRVGISGLPARMDVAHYMYGRYSMYGGLND